MKLNHRPNARRELFVRIVIVVRGDAQLPCVVQARGPACCFAGCLNGWQQQRDQDADDRYHNKQLDQGKGRGTARETRDMIRTPAKNE